MLLLGNCVDRLKDLEPNSVDACVTDAPYGLSFMNKKWDYDVPSVDIWHEVIRVLKPGGYLLSFGGTRTYHRMVVNIEDAGFEIRDQIQWLYGSGFPKSLDISKAIDKQAGVERTVIGQYQSPENTSGVSDGSGSQFGIGGLNPITAPATPDAKKWQGFGTALKPANEPIVLARKPLEKGLTVAENVLKYGTGGLNIDGCRVGLKEGDKKGEGGLLKGSYPSTSTFSNNNNLFADSSTGRFPANLILDEQAAALLDLQSGPCKTGNIKPHKNAGSWKQSSKDITSSFTTDAATGASRFFYVAKASKAERNAGLEGMPKKEAPASGQSTPAEGRTSALGAPRQNFHPCVKPQKLMKYLCRLITPPGGTVLDPFAGSGSTGVACREENFKFIGIEIDPEYYEIARNRIEGKP